MSLLLYPRTISIRRPNVATSIGVQPAYGGLSQNNETEIMSGISCSIQQQRHVKVPEGNMPSDAYTKAGFNVFIPKRGAALGSITERDVVVDDLGKRYQVTGAYWNILGYNLSTELMQV